jgi:hypothetical protein
MGKSVGLKETVTVTGWKDRQTARKGTVSDMTVRRHLGGQQGPQKAFSGQKEAGRTQDETNKRQQAGDSL